MSDIILEVGINGVYTQNPFAIVVRYKQGDKTLEMLFTPEDIVCQKLVDSHCVDSLTEKVKEVMEEAK